MFELVPPAHVILGPAGEGKPLKNGRPAADRGLPAPIRTMPRLVDTAEVVPLPSISGAVILQLETGKSRVLPSAGNPLIMVCIPVISSLEPLQTTPENQVIGIGICCAHVHAPENRAMMKPT